MSGQKGAISPELIPRTVGNSAPNITSGLREMASPSTLSSRVRTDTTACLSSLSSTMLHQSKASGPALPPPPPTPHPQNLPQHTPPESHPNKAHKNPPIRVQPSQTRHPRPHRRGSIESTEQSRETPLGYRTHHGLDAQLPETHPRYNRTELTITRARQLTKNHL